MLPTEKDRDSFAWKVERRARFAVAYIVILLVMLAFMLVALMT